MKTQSKKNCKSNSKKTRQGCSQNTKLSSSSRNGQKKYYRGQG